MDKARKKSLIRQRSTLIAGLIFLAVVLWMLSGVVHNPNSAQVDEPAIAQTDESVSVRIVESHNQVIQNQVIISGRTLADRSVAVKAETDGVVRQLYFERGDQVAAGNLLVELALESRDAQVLEARALVEQREIDFSGAQSLHKQDSISDTALASARAALESARARLRMAALETERTQIRAPIEGAIETREVEVGDFLSRGAPVATVVDLNPIRVRGSLSERYLNKIEAGSLADVQLVNGSIYEGKVAFVGRVAEAATRTFPVEVLIDNTDSTIIEGLTAEITLFADELSAHRLPSSMLTLADDGTLGVKGVNEANAVVFYPVDVVRDTPQGMWLSGLPEVARLIAVGHEFVRPGEQVETVPYGRPAAPVDRI